MHIKRVFNNNVALAQDANGREVIAIGRGICFGRRAGDPLDQARVEKVFSPAEPEAKSRLTRLVETIDPAYVLLAEEVVETLRAESGLAIPDALMVELADHLSLSIERERAHKSLPNPMLAQIKLFYRREFALAERAAEVIFERIGVRVSPDETGFIALHVVNATLAESADRVIASMELVKEILRIVSSHTSAPLNPESLAFERFVRHLQFFSYRVLDEKSEQADEPVPALIDRAAYPEAFACADAIADFVADARKTRVTDAEKSYLVYHLANLMGSSR